MATFNGENYLEEQIESLEVKLEESRLHIRKLEKALTDLVAKQENVTKEYITTLTIKLTQIKKLTARVTGLNQIIQTALLFMKKKVQEIDNLEGPRMEDITTQALVRAIISSPAIQSSFSCSAPRVRLR